MEAARCPGIYSTRITAGFNVYVDSVAYGSMSTRFRPLALDHDNVSDTGDGNSSPGGDRAAARQRSYKIDVGAQFRFTISCQFSENRYFFFFTVDRSREDKFQLCFPEFVADKNLLHPSR